MTYSTLHECEIVSRSIARWGSLAAAAIFGVAFLMDDRVSLHMVTGQATQIGLVLAIFAGYGLAWKERYEVLGSVIALLAVCGFFAVCMFTKGFMPNPFFLAIGLPALIHLVAVLVHRMSIRQPRETDAANLPC